MCVCVLTMATAFPFREHHLHYLCSGYRHQDTADGKRAQHHGRVGCFTVSLVYVLHVSVMYEFLDVGRTLVIIFAPLTLVHVIVAIYVRRA